MPSLDVIVKGTPTPSSKDGDLHEKESSDLRFTGTSADSTITITRSDLLQQDHNSKRVHSTDHDNIRVLKSVSGIPMQSKKMPDYSTVITPDVTPLKRKYDELLNQQHIDERLNEMKEEYDATITKKIQQLHKERQIRRRLEDRLSSQDLENDIALSKKNNKINSLVIELTRLDAKRKESDESLRKCAVRLREEETRNNEEKLHRDRLTEENTRLQMKVETLLEEEEKLTTWLSEEESRNNAEKVITNRLTEENTSMQMNVKKLLEEKEALTKTCKHLTVKSEILEKSSADLKQKAELKFDSYKKASENEKRSNKRKLESLTKENEELIQKLTTYEHLDKVISNTKEELECPICLERFTNPHVTKCGHRFCKRCIEEHIRQATKQKKEKTCPSCREPIVSKRDLRRDELITRVVDALFQE
ncbi:hypothetical protein CTEN210_13371 [Chaetoceros tenuissimus]|uniref:RING-type domain-containing protein n=1 Tax=Chaetoceros tenuissimus TaxID=426638 RepID=A0AAD3D528_9STRA|nr:hypothetical protein CTEN210_13371 [Chaetoceros tenuissimus]